MMNFGNPTSKEESFKIIDRAIEAGINLFDSADAYADGESERILGQALKRNGKRKEEMRLGTALAGVVDTGLLAKQVFKDRKT